MPATNRTIAIVDDDSHFNRAIQRLLQASGFETDAFGSGEDFLADSPSSYACLVLDIHLPGMSGFELFHRLSAYDLRPPVIFVTAEDRESIRDQAYQVPDSVFLQKPLIGTVLLEAVRGQLRRRHFDTE